MIDTELNERIGASRRAVLEPLLQRLEAADAAAAQDALAVADTLVKLRMDGDSILAGACCVAVHHGVLNPDQLDDAGLRSLVTSVLALDRLGDLHAQAASRNQSLESLRKMFLAIAQDLRGVVIKLALHLQTLRGLKTADEATRRAAAEQTFDIFAPLANRLGIGRLKWELEDFALRYRDPQTYHTLAKALAERRTDREQYIQQVMEQLRAGLTAAGIRGEVSGRVKHLYSIWRKMQRKHLPLDQIFDVRAVRVMVDSVADCYAALGVVHGIWNHVPKEFDDYIANPKPNGYQSLHTAVVGPGGRTVEIQIRSVDMHQRAELGVAAHWRYKEGGGAATAVDQQINWLRQILDWREEEDGDVGDLLDRFRAEAFSDRVYVITPRGEVVELGQGSTPLDFAYAVHTEIGHRCKGAKVNGRIVPLSYELRNGDQVDILTGKHAAPSRDWLSPHLNYLHSGRARAKVRQWFRLQDHDRNVVAGRQSVERELARLDVSIKSLNLQSVAERFNFQRPDELFAAVGQGDLTVHQVVSKLQEQILPPPRPESEMPLARRETASGRSGGAVQIEGVGQLLTQIAQCCRPVPPEPIAGFITRGRGVSIHREDCGNLAHLASRHPERLIDVSWGGTRNRRFTVALEIEAYDRNGLIRDISQVLANDKVNVLSMNTRTDKDAGVAYMQLDVDINDLEQLSRILDRIGRLQTVIAARRRGSG